LLCLVGGGAFYLSAQETLANVITCCDELKIKQAMTEEVLARILTKAAPSLPGNRTGSDYLSEQAFEKIKKRLPAGSSHDQLLAALRQLLEQPAQDHDTEEFQTLVGHFVLGMTLEIGSTLQDEFDQAALGKELGEKLLSELEKFPRLTEEDLDRSMFQVNLSEKELRRIMAMERKLEKAPVAASAFSEFRTLKKNITGRADDQDLWLVFELAEYYRPQFPFVDEFLKNYRRLGAEFLSAARSLNDLLSAAAK